jgi:hypothetical protein
MFFCDTSAKRALDYIQGIRMFTDLLDRLPETGNRDETTGTSDKMAIGLSGFAA